MSTQAPLPFPPTRFSFLEFFAGAGMVRHGLGPGWQCRFANDINPKKVRSYRQNWGDHGVVPGDVRAVPSTAVPSADLAWGSFPCQDLSLAGNGAGLDGARSGTFFPFWSHILRLGQLGRPPPLVALENVVGTLSSHGGADFAAICGALQAGGYRLGAMVIDAALFVPQSRPRLFVIGVHASVDVPGPLVGAEPTEPFHGRLVTRAYAALPAALRDRWLWWQLPEPPPRAADFTSIIEEEPASVEWHTADQTAHLLGLMAPRHLAKVEAAKGLGRPIVGGIYKRTRREDGQRVQRAEVRFDGLSGCLRTPGGGSSRQLIVVVHGQRVRTRLISARETARLMGLPDSYQLPERYNEAYHLTGDGVVSPVVRHLAAHLFEPLLEAARPAAAKPARTA